MIMIQPDGSYLHDSEINSILHFGPCAAHGTHECDYIKKTTGEKAVVIFPDTTMMVETCTEFDAL